MGLKNAEDLLELSGLGTDNVNLSSVIFNKAIMTTEEK